MYRRFLLPLLPSVGVLAFCPAPGALLPPPSVSNPTEPLIPASSFTGLKQNADSSYVIKAIIGSTEIFNYDFTAQPYHKEGRNLFETKFRIGSVSKLHPPLAILMSEDKGMGFEDSILKYVPELKGDVWKDVRLSDLAGHTSGLGRFGYVGDLAVVPDFKPAGLGISGIKNDLPFPMCDPAPGNKVCDRDQVIAMFNHPAETPLSPNSIPLYSNTAFVLLKLALEKVYDNKTYEEIISDLIFTPLNLTSASFAPPADNSTTFLQNEGDGWFYDDFANYNPTGGAWSTPNDLMKFMLAIRDNKFLSPAATRKWMQPRALLPSTNQLVGAPWEIFRPEDLNVTFPRPIDIYTKSGGVNGYAGYGILVPEYNLAVTINAAGNSSGRAVQDLMPIVMEALIPYADKVAREQAAANYAGTYMLPDTNSSITVALDNGPGLAITSFIMNSTNVLPALAKSSGIDPAVFSARLYPTDTDSLGTGKEFWRMVFDSPENGKKGGFAADTKCMSWNMLDRMKYIREPVDGVKFVMEGSKAKGVEMLAWRSVLGRVEDVSA